MSRLSLPIFLVALLCPLAAAAATYDLARDFDVQSNPSDVWSYGGYTGRGDMASFQVFTTLVRDFDGAAGLNGYLGGTYYSILQNQLGSNVVMLHPDEDGGEAVVRFTAPSTASYLFSGFFYGMASAGSQTTTDVHLMFGPGFDLGSDILGYGDIWTFSVALSLTAGAAVDFVVGYGPDGAYDYDTTQLALAVTVRQSGPPVSPVTAPVPLPAPAAALGLALGALALVGRGCVKA